MKGIILITLLLTIAVCATIGFTYNNNRRPTVNTIINTVGIAEHGLILIEPTDASYQQIMDTTKLNQTAPNLDALKPFSVLLKNNNHKVLIAFKLRWEIEDSNGQVVTTTKGYTNSKRLFDVNDKSKTKSVLEPNEVSFCSIAGVLPINQLSEVQISGITATAVLRKDDEAQQMPQSGSSDTSIADLSARLSAARKITVSIEGALFEDGVFIGSDSSNFYGWLSSLIESRRDLIQNLKDIQRDNNPRKVQKYLKKEIEAPRVILGTHSTSDNFYKFNKRRFAQSFLRLQNAVGADALRKELETTSDRWLNLRKF